MHQNIKILTKIKHLLNFFEYFHKKKPKLQTVPERQNKKTILAVLIFKICN